MSLIEWILFCLGHIALACIVFNRVHAAALPKPSGKKQRKITEKLSLAISFLPLGTVFYFLIFKSESQQPLWLSGYLLLGQGMGSYFLIRRLYRLITNFLPVGTRKLSRKRINIAAEKSDSLFRGPKGTVCSYVPFNQMNQLEVEYWEFEFGNFPEELSGMKICQISDLHFTGLIDKEYFAEVVSHANAGNPDLIFITGDILDEDICIDWIEEVLGKLQAKHGVFFIRGNHDLLVSDQAESLRRLKQTGMTWVADGRWHQLKIGESIIEIGGNEIPWYNGSADMMIDSTRKHFRILLAHSPDQIGWAVKRNVDLVFAGHTHGGQIRLPLIGPMVAPSRYGIKFASGTFKIRETLMHVSRGISGDEPIRINCPPELGFFTLTRSS